jgi:hypothetical protein
MVGKEQPTAPLSRSRGSYACGDPSGGVVGVNSATSYGSWKQGESVNLEQKSAFVQRCISLSERSAKVTQKPVSSFGERGVP